MHLNHMMIGLSASGISAKSVTSARVLIYVKKNHAQTVASVQLTYLEEYANVQMVMLVKIARRE